MNLITLQVPTCLTLGSKPISQVSAAYHHALTQGSCTVSTYSQAWGWTMVETKNFISFMSNWNEYCNIINNSRGSYQSSIGGVVGNNNKEIENNNNSTTTTTKQQTNITISEKRILRFTKLDLIFPVSKDTQEQLYEYVIKNTKCIDLLEYWLELYIQSGRSIDTIDAKQLGVISAAVRQNNDSKARLIFRWVFNSDDGKAEFMRSKGYLFPSSLINRGTMVQNYNLAMVWKDMDKTKDDKPLPARRAIPRFDNNGNIIE